MTDAQAPIVARLEQLERHLAEFWADPAARVLCWMLAPDEERLFEGFLLTRSQRDRENVELLVVDEPFTESAIHGVRVARALEEQVHALAAGLEDDGVYDVPWTLAAPPARLERRRGEPPPDQLYLCHALVDLAEHLAPASGQLTVCLVPDEVSDVEQYARWLSALAFLLVAPAVRVVVVCETESSWGYALARAHPARVRLIRADLDVPRALEEISAAADDAEEPSGRYRRSLIQARNALEKGDLAGARRFGEEAIGIARAENYTHLVFAAHQLLGSGALMFGDLRGAFASFENAEKSTHHDIRFGTSWLSPLLLQARMGKGTVAVTGGAWRLGARIFAEEALVVARSLADRPSEIECRRLAAYCEERSGNTSAAREHALAALEVGASLEPEERNQTSLPFVGQALLRLTKGVSQRRERGEIQAKLAALLGEDWEERLKPGSASPDDIEAAASKLEESAAKPEAEPAEPVERTLTAYAEALSSRGAPWLEATWDADAFVEIVERTWDARGFAPSEWPDTSGSTLPLAPKDDSSQR